MKKKSNIPRSHVASGSYIVSDSQRKIIEAYLGTCVGVTLCDPSANKGGLIHLLLPEPTSLNDIWQPETYATTGLPLFIQALHEAGARKGRLEACVAGGALVSPLSEIDLNLNIGGRTAEIVERILDQEGIPIRKSETGGFFTCRIALNLKTWESHIEPMSAPTDSMHQDFKKPTDEQVESALERVKPIPQIALKIIRMIRDENHGLQEMAKEIRQDQVISAKVIRLCNSAFFRTKAAIDSIDRALVILGEKRLMQLVVSASMENFFPKGEQGYSLCKGGLYQHAIGTAMISENLANFTGKVSHDVAYTAGLFHDIGKVVLDQYMASAYPMFYRQIQADGTNLVDAESKIFGITHAEAGRRLAERWVLPDSLIDTIKHHHRPEEATINSELTHIVYLADLLMSRFVVGLELDCLNSDALVSRLQKIGLNTEQFPAIIDKISQQIFNSTQHGGPDIIGNIH